MGVYVDMEMPRNCMSCFLSKVNKVTRGDSNKLITTNYMIDCEGRPARCDGRAEYCKIRKT